jgi:diguanylate cyclase
MSFELDDQWLEQMDRWGLSGLTVQRKRRLYRTIWVGAIGLSYLVDITLLLLFAWAGTIQTGVIWFYGAAGLSHVILFSAMHWTGFSERFANPHMTQWAMGYAILVQTVSIALAPQLTFFFLGIVFVIFAFGTLRISLRGALIVWLFAVVALMVTLGFFVHTSIGITQPGIRQGLVVTLGFAVILLRAIALGYYSTVQRVRMLERNHALKAAATRDALTGLANRSSVLPELEKYINLCRRRRVVTSVAMLDIDRFKAINDSFGHLVGDTVLKDIAVLIGAELRESDMAARYGGEEFIIVLPAATLDEALPALERIGEGVAALTWSEMSARTHVTVSCGVTEIVAADTVETLIDRADKALYEAKHAGRNRVIGMVGDSVADVASAGRRHEGTG